MLSEFGSCTSSTSSTSPPRLKANNIYADIVKAEQRIRKFLSPTPLIYSPFLSAKVNSVLQNAKANPCKVFLKLESENVTGSFKVRGAFNKVLVSKEKGEVETEIMSTSIQPHSYIIYI
jgi:threonine dehydratase